MFSMQPDHRNLVEGSALTALADSANHHGKSISHGTAHSSSEVNYMLIFLFSMT
jgi:hypothetical protein